MCSSDLEDEFDERDCLVARRFRDAQGAHSSWGNVREIRRVCNDWCEPIVERHLDRTGSPTKPGLYSPAITESTYDAEGLVTRRVCTDGPDNPVDCWFGEPHDEGSLVTITYDDKGRQQSQKGFTSVGVPSRIARNYPHEVRYEYGANGRLAAKSFFDEAGAPALGLGVARMEFEYDAAGSMTVERSLGIEAGLARPVTGCATIRTDYDAKHRTSVLECLGPDLRPAESDLIYRGVAWEGHASKVVVERDERGTARANVYFSPDGDEVGRVDCAGLKAYCYR